MVSSNKIELQSLEIFLFFKPKHENRKQLNNKSMARLSTQEIVLFKKLVEKRTKQALHMRDHSMRALKKGSSDIYSDQAHFVYELLQNADDAKATKAFFYLYKDRLIFKHNGKRQFTITEDGELGDEEKPIPYGDINSITAYSSTKDDEPNTIGKFGLGFKSVYKFTERPEIYDDKFWFAIEKRMIPVMLDHDNELREPGETLFVLPFESNDSIGVISEKLKSLKAPTLFLQTLGAVEYNDCINGTSEKYVKRASKPQKSKDITYQLVRIEDCGDKSKLLLFHRFISAENDQKLKVSIGYYFNKKGEIDTSVIGGIHCFFPTEASSGLCFISHAPFLLTNNRENLTYDSINKQLLSEICHLAADALVILKGFNKDKNQLLTDNLYDFLPYNDFYRYQSMYTFQAEHACKMYFLEAIKEVLSKHALLYTITKGYVTIDKACILSTSKLQNVLNTSQIRALLGINRIGILKIEEKKDLRTFLEEYLGIIQFKPEDLAKRITHEFMEHQGTTWAKKLYKYLKDDAVRQWDKKYKANAVFRYAPIFKSQNGEWIAPFKIVNGEEQPNIYLPIGKTRGSYNFVHESLIDENDDDLKGFYNRLGLKKPEIIDFIQKHIISKYQSSRIDTDDDVVLSDFNTVYQIYKDAEDDLQRSRILSLLSTKMRFKTINDSFQEPKRLYFRSDDICSYFGGDNNVAFLDIDLYTKGKSIVIKEKIIEFFKSIGVKSNPRILKYDYYADSYYDFNHNRKIRVDFENSSIGYSFVDYEIDGFTSFIENYLSLESSRYLWKVLSRSQDLDKYNTGTCRYKHYSIKTIAFQSTLFDNLKYFKWLINQNGEACSASEITQEEMLVQGYEDCSKLFNLLFIRKRTPSIIDLGGTEHQQLLQDLGEVVESFEIKSKEELIEILRRDSERKRAEEFKKSNSPSREPPHRDEWDESDDTFRSSSVIESSDLDDLFDENSFNKQQKITAEQKESDDSELDQQRIEEIKQRLEDDNEKKIQREKLRQEAEKQAKYTKEWFQKKLELEYRDSSDNGVNNNIKRSISVSFSKCSVDKNNNRIYELKNPSRDIPFWVEEVDNIPVVFMFNNHDELKIDFEVASVRDFSLRLKAKPSDANELSSIDWDKNLTQATININTPINLLRNLKQAFNDLQLPDGYNLKEHLSQNISFVFGPPGTGKTTFLAKHIVNFVTTSVGNSRVLVLTPTNKACDVLVKKIIEEYEPYSWLKRFVTTGESIIEENGAVCDRNSEIFKDKKCCIVTTTARLPYDFFETDEGHKCLKDIDWDLIICDEASMIPIAQITYAIYKFRDVPFIVSGDPMQIAPIDATKNWNSESIYDMVNLKSFKEPKTEPIQFPITNLETQYRSIPSIGCLFSNFAYDGQLKHQRAQSDQRLLNIPELPLKSVTYIPFRVESFDSLFGAKKLSGSSIHVYSALLATELSKFIAKEYHKSESDKENLKIGIICPYSSQAQIIEKLLEQVEILSDDVEITTGTVHSFQGDQCNIIITLFNPPVGLRYGASNIHLNNKNIINVAISRAKDYLIVLQPDRHHCPGYEHLEQINRLISISSKKLKDMTSVIPASKIEQIIFGKAHYLESNTFVTSHQLANVYTMPPFLYEIRVDENSVDILIGK